MHLVAPTTTSARMTDVLTEASGFVYCVSVTGVTGSRDRLDDSLMDYLQRVRTATQLPRAVGFGISRPEHVRSLHGVAEGAIAASALIDTMDAAAPAQAVAAAAASPRKRLSRPRSARDRPAGRRAGSALVRDRGPYRLAREPTTT